MISLRDTLYGDNQIIHLFKYEKFKYFPWSKNEDNVFLNPEDFIEYNDFENEELHFLLKFFIVSSEFQILSKTRRIIYFKGIPKNSSILCECGTLLDEKVFLKGIFTFNSPEKVSIFEYLLRISKKCKNCNRMIWIYRNIGVFPYFFKIFFKDFDFEFETQYTEEDIYLAWCAVVLSWLKTNTYIELGFFKKDLDNFMDILVEKLGVH